MSHYSCPIIINSIVLNFSWFTVFIIAMQLIIIIIIMIIAEI